MSRTPVLRRQCWSRVQEGCRRAPRLPSSSIWPAAGGHGLRVCPVGPGFSGVAGTAMIPSSARVWIAMGHTDMRKGMQGLALLVQQGLNRDPHGGDLYVFRGRAGSLVKLIWHDGIGMSLYAKRLEKGRFVWPSAKDGIVSLTASQLACLLDGIDWRNPGLSGIPCVGGLIDHQAAMARMNLSPKSTANCALATAHSLGGIFHSFSERFKIRKISLAAASSLGKWPRVLTARRILEFRASIALVV